MKISHKITNVSGKEVIYIYVSVDDIYEFGKENLGKGENSDFLTKLREYVNNNLEELKKAAAVIVINGVIIGSLTLAALYQETKNEQSVKNNLNQVQVYEESNTKKEDDIAEVSKEDTDNGKENIKQEKTKKEDINTQSKNDTPKETVSTASTTNKVTTTVNKSTGSNTKNTTTKKSTTTTNKSTNKTTTTNKTNSTKTASKPTTSNTTATTTSKSSTSINTSTNNSNSTVNSGRTIKFNNGGVVTNIDLEEYVIGVVAAEMPAAFHSEALKCQAVVARTYAMKKASKGITLVNSTSHQVYNSIAQMKDKWGSSYSTYYNKIKNAVNATKGQVLKYNGSYIDALYFSMSNGKTELPSYVWSTNYPYLQVVSSSWDANLSSATYSITMTYEKLSSKLGVTVNEDTQIEVLSRTAGDRVNEISIAGKNFTGVKVRSLLGLRSADFNIVKTSTGVKITTKGFGHGVGMSQYGANGAAKTGMTYKQILKHYYSGTSLVTI